MLVKQQKNATHETFNSVTAMKGQFMIAILINILASTSTDDNVLCIRSKAEVMSSAGLNA